MKEIISYANNKEYRAALRIFFNMNCIHPTEEMDDETYDELLYDSAASREGMDSIYNKTKDHPLFQQLYDLAASRMFSEDREVGLCILCCYDILPFFIEAWNSYQSDPDHFTETNEYYQLLKNKI